MDEVHQGTPAYVHCRTGSLETQQLTALISQSVHCRTGSLEILKPAANDEPIVHCRTGSLERKQQSRL